MVSINPGTVFQHRKGSGFTFTIIVNGNAVQHQGEPIESANAAKQTMRETVATLRRQHGIGESQ